MASQSDIDRLIEVGLHLYGAGDLDGALLVWEEALAADPDNAQANSYVDYVRSNYELLTSSEHELTDDDGFAISEEPEYQIEIEPGDLPGDATAQHAPAGEIDEGWAMDGDAPASPPLPLPPPGDSFEEATREFQSSAPRPSEAPPSSLHALDFGAEPATSEFRQSEVTGAFESEGTPVGFANQETEIRKRDLGFVKPQAAPQPVQDKPSSPLSVGHAPTMDLGTAAATMTERSPFAGVGLDDLAETQDIPVMPHAATRELPSPTRPPAPPTGPPPRRDSEALSQAEVVLPHAATQDFKGTPRIDVSAPTRELGLRPPSQLSNPTDEDAPTKQSDVRAIRNAATKDLGNAPAVEGTRHDIVLPFDPIDARTAQILDEVDENAPPDEPKEEQTRRRIVSLLQRASEYNASGETDKAVAAVDLVLSEDPNSALGQKLITRNKETILQIFQAFIGDLERMPQLARPLHELSNAPISPRAAFLLSRIDGTLTIDELLDVSGMPRMEAYRHICQLFLRGILR